MSKMGSLKNQLKYCQKKSTTLVRDYENGKNGVIICPLFRGKSTIYVISITLLTRYLIYIFTETLNQRNSPLYEYYPHRSDRLPAKNHRRIAAYLSYTSLHSAAICLPLWPSHASCLRRSRQGLITKLNI